MLYKLYMCKIIVNAHYSPQALFGISCKSQTELNEPA